jgi:hypothetical protein
MAAKADMQFAAIQTEIEDDDNQKAMSLFNSKLINQSDQFLTNRPLFFMFKMIFWL